LDRFYCTSILYYSQNISSTTRSGRKFAWNCN
jgi:hypothetical protein